VKPDVEILLREGGGVIRRRDHPKLAQRLDRLRARGELITVLPGLLSTPEGAQNWSVRLRAGLRWAGRDAVVTRYAAARLTFWPDCPVDEISFAVSGNPPRRQPGWPVVSRLFPPEMIWERSGVRLTGSAYTAVDLADSADAGDIVDRALRSRQATLPGLWAALSAMPGRRGNVARARILRDSRDSPWSELERLGHRLLRRERIVGWRTNVWVPIRDGGYFADLMFGRQRLIVEFDGWEFHNDRKAFEDDRRRRNELVLAGYVVLNFTWRQLENDPDWVIGCIRKMLRRGSR
jgi:very-short-patch-repair endonuclease